MKDQVLSIRRMKHLKKLGVDVSKASMVYNSDGTLRIMDEVTTKKFIEHPQSAIKVWCPAFTLQDMIEMIPQDIEWYTLHVSKTATAYLNGWSTMKVFCKEGILTNTYNMLCWIAENNLLTEEEKNENTIPNIDINSK